MSLRGRAYTHSCVCNASTAKSLPEDDNLLITVGSRCGSHQRISSWLFESISLLPCEAADCPLLSLSGAVLLNTTPASVCPSCCWAAAGWRFVQTRDVTVWKFCDQNSHNCHYCHGIVEFSQDANKKCSFVINLYFENARKIISNAKYFNLGGLNNKVGCRFR